MPFTRARGLQVLSARLHCSRRREEAIPPRYLGGYPKG